MPSVAKNLPSNINLNQPIDMSRTTTMDTIPSIPTSPTSQTMDTTTTGAMDDPTLKPSPTMDTLPTARTIDTASTLPTIQSYQGSRGFTIEHKVRGQNRGLLFGMSKPIFLAVAVTLLTTSGGAAYLFKQWLRIPGLRSQIDELESEVFRLENQVDRLSVEIDQLAAENDRFASLNSELNVTVREYSNLNQELNSTTSRLHNITDQLNISNLILEGTVAELATENEEYENLNDALNSTNNELSRLNFQLSTVASFLNETANGIQHTFEGLTSFLAEQINVNRGLLLDMVENTYMQRIATWECEFLAYFRGEEFVYNANAPMDDVSYELAMDYLEGRVLSVLCLDRSDFELYLDTVTADGLSGVTFNTLARGISVYTTAALDYYFPALGESSSLTTQEWEEASYTCENLLSPFAWNWNQRL